MFVVKEKSMNILSEEIREDPTLLHYNFNSIPLLQELRDQLLNAPAEVCIERAVLMTDYIRAHQSDPVQRQRAGAVAHYLSNRKVLFSDNSLLAGSSTLKRLGAPLYPEYFGLCIWPELDTISTRGANPQRLDNQDAQKLNLDIFPFWLDRSITERARSEFDDREEQAMDLMQKMINFLVSKATVISHVTPDYSKVLTIGLKGIKKEAQDCIDTLQSSRSCAEREKKIVFYRSLQVALEGICRYAENIAKEAAKQAEQTIDVIQKKNLQQIAQVCSNVPAKPPKSFREAVNAILLCHIGVLAENVNMALNPGRLDQLLYPFFKKDYESGTLSIEEAVAICGCLWLKFGDNTNLVPETSEELFGGAGSVPAITLGGVDKDGNDAVNDLTFIMLRVTELLKLRDPNVNVRIPPRCNSAADDDIRKILERTSQVVINTKAIPAFYNDSTNIETLKNQGISEEDARDYAIVGCVELASPGRDYSDSGAILLNLTAPLELALYNGKRPNYDDADNSVFIKTGDTSQFNSFKEFTDAFKEQLKWMISQAITLDQAFARAYQKYLPTPLLSGLFDGPMEKGVDLVEGGARYNSSGVTHIGFAEVCDSLNAIEYLLDQKRTMSEIVDAVKANFSGTEANQIRELMLAAPKYGQDDPKAMKNSRDLVRFLYDTYDSYHASDLYRNVKFRPAFWTMTNHAGFGKITGALPNGRVAKEVFSSGITPASLSPRALVETYNAVANLDHMKIPGGYALNIKYNPFHFDLNGFDPDTKNEYLKLFADYIAGYFQNNGMQVQFNLYSHRELLEARKNPAMHRDLIVRVSGYSAFFRDLNENMKDELISRTLYDLFINGKPVYQKGSTV